MKTKIWAPPSTAAPKRYCVKRLVSMHKVAQNRCTHVVLPEPPGAVLADVEMRRQADEHPGVNVAVGSTSEITDVV